ncbi:MAG TPA: beta-ketoacyl synthase N-terminal-like domain-containing protein [Coleofasciculaceae cyanobacterium]
MSLEISPTDIAIIGMSALFPGAKDLRTYWQNILNKVDAIQEAPDKWAKPYFEPNSKDNDRVYTRKGGFLGDLAEFNAIEFGVMPNSVEGSDPDHFLALKLARDALDDAGYTQKPFNQEKTGIILGRGSYINRGFTNVVQHGMMVDQTLDLLRQLNPALEEDTLSQIRKELKAGLLPFNAEMAPGIVPNVVTGRIANRLGLMGPNYIIDAACASSLVSVELAIKELLSHRCDMMLAGGVHAPAPPQLHMMFCQLGALSRSNIRPFDQSANGTLLSEGIGIVVLKRLADAEQDGDRIYAVIKGVGSSSDGKALGLLAPRLEGEVLAIQRAYTENNIDPDTVTLVEAHGTGIPLGDKTELRSLTQVFGQRRGQVPHRALGSVKSMIGHSTIAAGAASLIKTALALYHKILPPTLCDEVNPALEIEKTSFYINNEARPWIHGLRKVPRRAGVNAFGFGGVNAHAVLEEYTKAQPQDTKLLHNQWPTELLLFSANNRTAVVDAINKVQQILQVNPSISLANLAYSLSTQAFGSHRLAIIARDVPDLESKLNLALEKLKDTERNRLQVRSGIYYAQINPNAEQEQTAFLFPGEGSQYPNMLADLCLYFPKVREWFDLLDETFAETREHPSSRFIFPPPTGLTKEERRLAKEQSFRMDVASESVFTASMALYELLCDLGIKSDVMVGHSTGESTALIASGIVGLAGREELMEKIRHHNRIASSFEANDSIPKGVLLAVGAVDSGLVQQLVDTFQGRLHLAMDNCPNQVVLFGSDRDIDAAVVQLQAAGGICIRLPFDRGYHTPLFEKVAIAFREFYDGLDVGSGHTPLYSCATTEPFPTEAEGIRALAAKQWSNRVCFRETIEKLYNQKIGTFIEVGPSSNLTGFVDDILRGREYLALASNNQRRSGLEQIQHLLARLCVKGIKVDMTYLYKHREVTQVNLDTASLGENGFSLKSPVLELTMPRLQLRPEFIQTIQDKLSAKEVLSQSVSGDDTQTRRRYGDTGSSELGSSTLTTNGAIDFSESPRHPVSPERRQSLPTTHDYTPLQENHQSPIPNHQSPITNSQPPTDSRLSLLCSHFDLMQEFLASQGRVMTTLSANLANWDNVTNGSSVVDVGTRHTLPLLPRTPEEAWPLLGRIIEKDFHHLYCERRFDLEHDVFLHDHTLGPTPSKAHPELLPLPVIPLAISMEILAEAAAYLLGGEKLVIALYNVRGYRWLALEQGQLDLGILAQLQPKQDEQTWDVHVQLFQYSNAEANNRVLVVEGYVRLSDQFPSSPNPEASSLENPRLHIWSDAELYSHGMYHGPCFQGVKHIRQVGEQGIEADLQVISLNNLFRHIEQPVFLIHPLLLDAATHLIPYWVVDQFRTELFHSFPFEVTAFQAFEAQLSANSTVLCRGRMSFLGERQIQSNFDFIDETGRVIARLEGLLAIYLDVPGEYHQCRQDLQTTYWSKPCLRAETGLVCRRLGPPAASFLDELGGVIKPIVAHWMLNEKEREFWYSLPEKGPRRSDWLLGRIAAKDALRQWAKATFQLELAPVDIEILSAELGKPIVRCPELERLGSLPALSISHSRGYVVAAVAKPGMCVGIDIQRLDGIRADDVLNGAFTQPEIDLLAQLPQQDQATSIVGLWCAKEAAAKASSMGLMGDPRQWQVSHYSLIDAQVVIIHAGKSFQVKLDYTDGEILAICHQYSE